MSAFQISEENYKHIRTVGDINGDSILNINDIIMLIHFIIYDMRNILPHNKIKKGKIKYFGIGR